MPTYAVTLTGLTITGAAAAASDSGPGMASVIIAVAAVLTALGVIWKALKLGDVLGGMKNFLKDYNGEPARPGHQAVPGMPERLAKIEEHTHELKGAFPSMVVALDELNRQSVENGTRLDRVDQRITDHRRRNDETAAALRDALERRAELLEAIAQKRDAKVTERLENLSDDLLRAETYRASLLELGIQVDPPPRPQQ